MIGKIILFASKGDHAASTRYRALDYFDMLRKDGWFPIHIPIHGTFSRLKLLRLALRADVVVILRKTFSCPYLQLLRKCSRCLIFDFDDAIFCRDDGSASPNALRRFAQIVRRSDLIWAGNDYLAHAARSHNEAVYVLPTSLDPQKYRHNLAKPSDSIDLVWIGSSSTRKYLEQAIPALERLAADFPFLRLKIVADFDLPLKNLQTVAVPWSEKAEQEALGTAHIGIAPMEENPWTRGKCGLKVLQYMAAGIPVVTSPAGVNREIVEQGKTGFLAEHPEEWETAIDNLIHDSDLRQTMGRLGRSRVIKDFSLEGTYRKIAVEIRILFEKRNSKRQLKKD